MKRIKSLKLKIKNRTKGFTLVELLIVISIIGVLSALLMANFIGVRQRARDSQRKANLRQIQSALELYRSDQSSYPTTAQYPDTCNIPSPLTAVVDSNTVTYMSNIPCDPNGVSYQYNSGKYYYLSDGSEYTLAACLENTGDVSAETITVPPSSSPGGTGTCTSGKYYVLLNP